MSRILCGILMLALSSVGLCIQCYKCTSISLTEATFSEVCTDEKFNISVVPVDHCNKRCIKFVAEGKNIGAVHRGCFPMPTENGCNEGMMFNQNGKVCYCDTDLCNGAVSPDLMCYNCNYHVLGGLVFGTKECSDKLFNSTIIPLKKCAGSCSIFKVKIEDNDNIGTIVRGCTELKTNSKCQNGTLGSVIGEYCFCNGDRCNNSHFLTFNKSAFSLLILILLITYL